MESAESVEEAWETIEQAFSEDDYLIEELAYRPVAQG